MVKKVFIIFIVLFALSATDSHGLQIYFWIAQQAEKEGNYDKALSLYNKVLEKYPNETQHVLKAYDKMLKIYKDKNESQKIQELLSTLKANYPNESFNPKNLEKLSLIYLKYGETDEALKNQWMLLDKPYLSIYKEAVLRTYSSLLKYYSAKNDTAHLTELLSRVSTLPLNDFDDGDLYKIAMLYLKYGNKQESIKIMQKIVQDHPHTTSARKSLFVLAEQAQKEKDCEKAMGYYSTYIERYPENTFYVQKAYQRIVDCYIVMGNKGLSEETMKQVADWVNGISEYRSQLNFAIDLKSKNMDTLAEATFNTGYHEAKKVITENPGTYEALKAYLEIQRSAYAMVRFDIVEKAALATLKDFDALKGNAELNKNTSFIKSQAYLHLAKIYSDSHRHDDTIKTLEDFLKKYPDHKDTEYAAYELGKAYEGKGEKEKAKRYYEKITQEPLKGRAKARLDELK